MYDAAGSNDSESLSMSAMDLCCEPLVLHLAQFQQISAGFIKLGSICAEGMVWEPR